MDGKTIFCNEFPLANEYKHGTFPSTNQQQFSMNTFGPTLWQTEFWDRAIVHHFRLFTTTPCKT